MKRLSFSKRLTALLVAFLWFTKIVEASTTSCSVGSGSKCVCVRQPLAGSFAANNDPANFVDPNGKVCKIDLNDASQNSLKNEAFLSKNIPTTAIFESDGLLGDPARSDFRLQFANLFAEKSETGSQPETFGWHTHPGVRYVASLNGQGIYRIYDPICDKCVDFILTPNNNSGNNAAAITEIPGIIHNLFSRDAAFGPPTGEAELLALDIHKFVDRNHDGKDDNGCSAGGSTCYLKSTRNDAGPTKVQQRLGAPRASVEFVESRPNCARPPGINP